MKNTLMGGLVLLGLLLYGSRARATHIEYVNVADVTNATLQNIGDKLTWKFDLVHDAMYLWEIDTHYDSPNTTPDISTYDFLGSYDPSSDLHYVYLRIDPANIPDPPQNQQSDPLSDFLELTINGHDVSNWNSNPLELYNWGEPGGSIEDPYKIATTYNYTFTVTLTVIDALPTAASPLDITNVNLEGCFDAAPVPEPATMVLFGSGLAAVAGWTRRKTVHKVESSLIA
ncbi:PEP-CTERM sorting domain-containing protein [Desulfolithobacter sp.]